MIRCCLGEETGPEAGGNRHGGKREEDLGPILKTS